MLDSLLSPLGIDSSDLSIWLSSLEANFKDSVNCIPFCLLISSWVDQSEVPVRIQSQEEGEG